MNKFKAILVDSLLEIKSGKMLYVYGAVTFVVVLLLAIIPSFEINGEEFLSNNAISDGLISGAVTIFFDKFIGFMIFLMYLGSAWLMPSYLKKGRIELTLSKPINRVNLLSMKFASVYLINIAILTVVVVAIWATLSFRLETFSVGLFTGLFAAYVQFLVIYVIIFALGLITRSGAFSLMGYFIILITSGLLESREIVYNFIGGTLWKTILDVLYHILPKFNEMSESFTAIIEGNPQYDMYPILSTLAFTAVLYLITLWVFQKRDY